jgi:hypothetical protein
MQASTENEYVLDAVTASRSDWILTMPTRRFYRTATAATAPFGVNTRTPGCDTFTSAVFDRGSRLAPGYQCDGLCPPMPLPPQLCEASAVWIAGSSALPVRPVFGSINAVDRDLIAFLPAFQNGWARFTYNDPAASIGLVSLPASMSIDMSNGAATTGRFRVKGLPVIGFMARTFSNGTLTCSAGTCQGNYGSAFPHKAVRSVEPAP